MVFLKSIVIEKPVNVYNQEEVLDFARKVLPRWLERPTMANVFKNAKIDERSFAIPLECFLQENPVSIEYKSSIFERESRRLGKMAAEKAIYDAKLNKNEIDAIITVTTTGLVTPSLSAKIALDLGLKDDVTQYPAVGWGCCGGVLGLMAARDYVKAGYKNVLLIGVELCSTTFLQSDDEKENFIGTALFADGAAALIVNGDKENAKAELLDGTCTLLPDTENVMGWKIKEDGWKVVFGVNVPAVASAALPATIERTLRGLGWQHDEVCHWLPHPGGAKVLDVIEAATGSSVPDAWETLRRHGNMSSVSVLAVLDEALNKGRKGRAMLSAMGPGFNIAHLGVIL